MPDTNSTSGKPMPMVSSSNYKESNKVPVRCGKHRGSIKPHENISSILHKKYTGSRKTNEGNPREKEAYASLIGESRGILQGR